MAAAPVQVKMIDEVAPFGDVPLAPADATGRSEAELARAIVGLLRASDALPPLRARLTGVGALTRRGSRSDAQVGPRKRAA